MKRSNPWLISALGILAALVAVIRLVNLHLPDCRADVYAAGEAALGILRLLKPGLPIAMQHTSSALTSASGSAVSEALRAPDISYEKQRHHLQASGRVSKIDFEPFVSYRCYTEWWGLGNQHHSEEGKE